VLGPLNISLLSARLSVQLVSSSAHTFDVSSGRLGSLAVVRVYRWGGKEAG